MDRLIELPPDERAWSWTVHLLLAWLFGVGPRVEFGHELAGDFEALFGDEDE